MPIQHSVSQTLTAVAAVCAAAITYAQRPSARPAVGPHNTEAAQQVRRIADEFLAAFAARDPASGLPGTRPDRLFDNRITAYRDWWAKEDAWLARLRHVDASALRGTPDWVLHGVLREHLEVSVQGRVCRRHLWWLDTDYPLGAPHVLDLPALASRPIEKTPDARAAALQRWSKVPAFVDVEIENLRAGVREHYTAPRVRVAGVVEELDRLLARAVDESPFFTPGRRDPDPDFQQQLRELITQRVNPALRRFRDFLAGEYSKSAREIPGLAGLPDGPACWRAQLRRHTTLPIDPAEIASMGEALLRTNSAARDRLARERYGLADGRALSSRLASDPALAFASSEETLNAARATLERVQPLLPRYFGRIPAGAVPRVETAALGPGIAARYQQGPADGSGARVVLNTRAQPGPNRVSLPLLMLHEGVPGHHLQSSIARERGEGHPLTRYLGVFPAYSEGWATYAAGPLAREMGMAADDLALGHLANLEVITALSFVAENGIHAHGWTSEQAVDTLARHMAGPREAMEAAVQHVIGWPGHSLAFGVGAAEILRLRRESETQLGSRFDVRAFHDVVLEEGRMTLGMLREKVRQWVAERHR